MQVAAIVGPDADLDRAAHACCSARRSTPDRSASRRITRWYPAEKVDAFASALARCFTAMYPSLRDNTDYTSIVNERHLDRLQACLVDAREKGATVRSLDPTTDIVEGRKLPLHLVLDPSDDMRVMQEELFGPVLPIVPYTRIDDAIAHVNVRARPLALYYFGDDPAMQERVLAGVVAGGVTINDTIMHLTMDNLPFGGVGPSGIGAYHGFDGSGPSAMRAGVYRQGWFDAGRLLRPPYGRVIDAVLKTKIRR